MWEALGFVAGMVDLAGLVWGLSHLIKKSQTQDRRYGNPDGWGSD
jgi:hypothetical protein